jgi:hypothetical protein
MQRTPRTWKTGYTRHTTHQKPYGRTTTHTGWQPTTSYSPSKYTNYRKEVQAKIASYRNLNQQWTGTGKVTAFSPTGANKWLKYVNQGAWIYKFNNNQFCRYFGDDWAYATLPAVYRYFQKRFGSGIKGVTRGKGNIWLVAAMPTVTARPFYNYPWK